MSLSASLVSGLNMSHGLLKQHLADFTDADMLVRPVPNANHAAWQLGHLLQMQAASAAAVAPGTTVTLPAKLEAAQAKANLASDDPAIFPSKTELLSAFEKANDALVEGSKKMSDADFEKPGPEAFRSFAPTMGDLISMCSLHVNMHLGQIQVIRRKLGKPLIF